MAHIEQHDLAGRLDRLERKNRILTALCGLCLAVPLLAVAGWQSASDTVRVKRLEVVDDRGVPLITLGATRNNLGGSITLRDSDGERRSWWEVAPGSGAFTLNSANPNGDNDTTLGLQVGEGSASMAIVSKSGAVLSNMMAGDEPSVELYNDKGATLFAAPVRNRR
jgi:hypothetical protein